MTAYIRPVIDVLYFDEEDIITVSGEKGRNSADLMNEYFFDSGKAGQTTTVTLQDIQVNIGS